MPPSAQPAPRLRILDRGEAEERARDRQGWADLWRAIAREADAADETPTDDEESAA
jgi:hypothetical protein